MTDDNSTLVDMDDLNAFENAFYGKETEPKEAVEDKEDIPENEDDALATDEDTDASEDEKPTEDDEPEDEEPKEEPKPKGKKSFQDRIDELTRGKREAERREADLLRRLDALEARKTEETQSEPKPLRESLPAEAPNPDALDANGEPIYKLGEYDPQFIRDLTKFEIDKQTKAAKEAVEAETQQKQIQAQQEELQNSWAEKVAEAEKELPDLREKLGEMEAAFTGIDPSYGEYLAATIMTCDFGPQIMHYLSQNIGEAQKIVASGPAAATLAIGRLDAKFTKITQEEKRNTKKVSVAPEPPDSRVRGSSGKFSVAPDTDDLDAFERAFFNKK